MTTATETMPQTEVMYRTLIYVARTHEDTYAAFRIVRSFKHNLEQGGCTGIGLSIITLLCTPGEAATVAQKIREAGIECKVIGDTDAPHRPSTWAEPCYRDN